ncbi:cell division protein DivIC [Ligilactobacillus sp. WC1T17]|uniref:Cell division protein DivIC n=1 Tax=Ligilactobacillus ruminis TaxID=1623 RepID=A0ABY1ACD6_9LACO|nr:cell division protein DivIC [Ligilactobacillus ruminis]
MKDSKISVIDNPYYQKQMAQRKAHDNYLKEYRSYLLFRNVLGLIVLFVVLGAVFATATNSLKTNSYRERQTQASAKLKKVTAENKQLNLQVAQLNDNDYVQKLIRKKYLYSKNNEIIFSLKDITKKTSE